MEKRQKIALTSLKKSKTTALTGWKKAKQLL